MNEKSALLQSGNEVAVARNDLEASFCPSLLGCAAQGMSAGEGPSVLVLGDTCARPCARGCHARGSRMAADLRAFCSSSLYSGARLQQGSARRLALCWLLATCRRLLRAPIKAPLVQCHPHSAVAMSPVMAQWFSWALCPPGEREAKSEVWYEGIAAPIRGGAKCRSRWRSTVKAFLSPASLACCNWLWRHEQ